MSQASVEHITVDEKGVARLIGRRTKVSQIAMDAQAGLSPVQIKAAYPDLTLSEIHAALAYYYDHQTVVDAQILDANESYERGLAEQRQNLEFQARIAEIKLRAAQR